MEVLIKSRARVKARGEVFTPDRIVQEMLDLIPVEEFKTPFSTFLEPACGTGNFLIAIFRRKMKYHNGLTEPDDLYALKVISNLFAIEIDEENVMETKARMLECLEAEVSSNRKPQFLKTARKFLDTNIVQGDCLDFDFGRFHRYHWNEDRYFIEH